MNELSAADLLSKWSELTSKHSTHGSYIRMTELMMFHGYKKLGFGMYGSAWLTPNGSVIKTNFSMQGAKDGWWLWATLAMELRNNPWLPKVYSILRDGNYYVAHVEKLYDVMEGETLLPYRDSKAVIPKDDHFADMIDKMIEARSVYGNVYGKGYSKEFYLENMANNFDLHRGNWMWRREFGKEHQLVLNDPINSLEFSISDTALAMCVAQAA